MPNGTASTKCGPVAQLGARFHGMEEVIGSNPIRSTKLFKRLRASARQTSRPWSPTGVQTPFAVWAAMGTA